MKKTTEIVKREFTVFKNGVTRNPVHILSINGMDANGKHGQPFDVEGKKAFYKWLGYTVTDAK